MTLTPGDQQFTVSWTAVTDATMYLVSWNWAAYSGFAYTQDSADTMAAITQSANGTSVAHGYQYRAKVQARNNAGSGPESVTKLIWLPPPPVTLLDLTPSGSGQVAVSWTAPADPHPTFNGYTITGYEVQYKKSTASDWTDAAHTGTGTSHTITGLSHDTTYDVRVGAKNDGGTGERVEATVTTTNPAGKPAASAFHDIGKTSVDISFRQDDTDRASFDYQFDHRPKSGSLWNGWQTFASPYIGFSRVKGTVTGMRKDTLQVVRIRACRDDADDSTCGEALSAEVMTAPEIVHTPPPSGLSATASEGSSAIALAWSAASGYSAATYEIDYSHTEDFDWVPEKAGLTTTSDSITGLSVGNLYGFRVRARNSSGVSDWSDIAWERVPDPDPNAKPGRMNHPKLQIGEAQGSVDLSWWKPVSGGAPTSYEYQYRQAGGSWTVVTGQSGYSATHTGLPRGVAYQFQVRARNTAGAGEWSYHDSWITLPTSKPSAPSNFVLQPGATTIHVSFGGAEPARYWQIQIAEVGKDWSTPPDDYDDVRSRVYMIRGLTNGKSYRVRVRGWNPEGYGPWSSNHNVTLVATFPDPVSVSAGYQALEVSWPSVPDTASYSVRHRLQGSTDAWTTATGISGLAHSLGALSAGSAYELQVGAVKGSTTTWSVLAHGTPHGNAGVLDPPTHFGIQASASQSITLSWRTDDEGNSLAMASGMAVRASEDLSEAPTVEYELQYKVQGET